ncbi:hypothetical protein MTR67_031200 [Solanum verrucosum]|uniref:Integrase zinc-binding domain-containing protein n=1 Tax=Solanum verrucosum TaxID=315347 RepID=A0AAF0U207_SOLVR|nr:hypothetical protein MTR67_031200 [Solanum verrucosum]
MVSTDPSILDGIDHVCTIEQLHPEAQEDEVLVMFRDWLLVGDVGRATLYSNGVLRFSCMRRDIVDYVSYCLSCQQFKAKYLRPCGEFQRLPILYWKWDHISMDIVAGLPQISKGVDIWVIIDRLTNSTYFLPFQSSFGTKRFLRICCGHVFWSLETVWYKLDSRGFGSGVGDSGQATDSLEKTLELCLPRWQPLRFSIGDRVFHPVSPMNGIIRFQWWGKLRPKLNLLRSFR